MRRTRAGRTKAGRAKVPSAGTGRAADEHASPNRAHGALRWFWLIVVFGTLLAGPATAQDGSPPTRWFAVETLNEGLTEPPADLYRETPQGALETFLSLAGEDDAERTGLAAQLLDLSRIEPDRRRTVGGVLAGQLAEVIERKVWIDWADLPDRPDGLTATGGSEEQRAGEPRRSIAIATLDLDGRPVPLRLNRLKPANGDPVWVFSAQTVENIGPLFERYGPKALERAFPDALKAKVVLGLALWELIALPVVLGLIALAGILAFRSTRAMADRVPSQIAGNVLDALALPLAIIAAAVLGSFVTRALFTFSAPIDTFLAPALTILTIAAVLFAAVHVIDLLIDHLLADDVQELEKPENAGRRRFQTNVSAARRVGLVIAFTAGIGLVMTQVGAFRTAGISLLGSAGVLTIVLAYAGRTALSNIMASLQIAISKSAMIGDAVKWQGQWCYVEKINFTYVQLESWDKRRLIVPVNDFVSQTFENWTKRDPTLTKIVEIRLNHLADVDALRERFEAWLDTRDDISDRDGCSVQVTDHDATGMVVRFVVNAPDPSTAWDMHCALREAMVKAAAELDTKGEHGGIFLPAEREAKIVDLTRDAAE